MNNKLIELLATKLSNFKIEPQNIDNIPCEKISLRFQEDELNNFINLALLEINTDLGINLLTIVELYHDLILQKAFILGLKRIIIDNFSDKIQNSGSNLLEFLKLEEQIYIDKLNRFKNPHLSYFQLPQFQLPQFQLPQFQLPQFQPFQYAVADGYFVNTLNTIFFNPPKTVNCLNGFINLL